jgi:hypothetical protein
MPMPQPQPLQLQPKPKPQHQLGLQNQLFQLLHEEKLHQERQWPKHAQPPFGVTQFDKCVAATAALVFATLARPSTVLTVFAPANRCVPPVNVPGFFWATCLLTFGVEAPRDRLA